MYYNRQSYWLVSSLQEQLRFRDKRAQIRAAKRSVTKKCLTKLTDSSFESNCIVLQIGMRVMGDDNSGNEFTLVLKIQDGGTDQVTNRQGKGTGKMSNGNSEIDKSGPIHPIGTVPPLRCCKSRITTKKTFQKGLWISVPL